jgi:holo-[acyl-carrier protein] synthase
MIIGIGTDIASIPRIAQAMQNPAFINRILTPAEQNRELTPEYVAGRWAAKEAIKKAFPCVNSWHQVEVLNEPNQPPKATICHPAFQSEILQIHITISHERDLAIAFAVIDRTS